MQNGNSEGKVSPGQPFSAPKAEIWNSMVDAGNAHRTDRLSTDTPERTRPRQSDVIKLKNSSGAARSRGEILRINGKAVTDLSDEHIWLTGSAPTESGYFGILKEPIENGSVGQVQVSGCCIAQVNIADANHTRANAIAASYVLGSSDDGPIEILYAPSGTGELECVVRFGGTGGGGGGGVLYRFTLNASLASGTADADILLMDGTDTGIDADVLDPVGIFATLVTVGDAGLCILQSGVYYVIQAKCPV
jgi:hypothetical protein